MTNLLNLEFCLSESEKQVRGVFNGLEVSHWGFRPLDFTRSARQTAEHLAQCYDACAAHAKGEPWDWAAPFTFVADDGDEALELMFRGRGNAIQAVLESSREDAWKLAIDYIVLHEAYHVGQMATLRLALNPDWDPYSIYG